MGNILKTEDLLTITGYNRAADVERCLREQGITYFHGKGGKIWTTLELVNAAGGLKDANSETPYAAEVIK